MSAATQNGLVQLDVGEREREVSALVVDPADVHLAQASAERVDQHVSQLHAGIDCLDVRDVEAETRFGKFGEIRLELIDVVSARFPCVHVLEREELAERRQSSRLFEDVRMHDNGGKPRRDRADDRRKLSFAVVGEFERSVQTQPANGRPRTEEVCRGTLERSGGECRKLECLVRPTRGASDERRPAAVLEHLGRYADGRRLQRTKAPEDRFLIQTHVTGRLQAAGSVEETTRRRRDVTATRSRETNFPLACHPLTEKEKR